MSAKRLSLSLLVLGAMCGMSPWFASAAVLPDMAREGTIDAVHQALLSSAVQAGFVVGALVVSISGIADRLDPRRVFAGAAVAAAIANATLLLAPIGGDLAVLARFFTGACLAGVYPVGMKIAVGWGQRDRGLLVGLLVGALTIGSASPSLAAYLGGTAWRSAIVETSLLAAIGGLAVFAAKLGPHHARAPRFEPGAIRLAWTDRRIRRAYLGYFGHMWELYAMWAWIGAFFAASFAARYGDAPPLDPRLATFCVVAIGAVGALGGGFAADRLGRTFVTALSMAVSGLCAVGIGFLFGASIWLVLPLALVWGVTVISDSAQFSAAVTELSDRSLIGTMLTVQTCVGFLITLVSIHLLPYAVDAFSWRYAFLILAIGPFLGVLAMLRLRLRPEAASMAGGRR